MRKSCLVLAMSAFLVLPLFAQKKSGPPNDGYTGPGCGEGRPAGSARAQRGARKRNVALPASPRPRRSGPRPPLKIHVRPEAGAQVRNCRMFEYINFSPAATPSQFQ
jgi:hypothetical protein